MIGGTLEAALYAFVHDLPIIYNFETIPKYFEFLSPDIDLSPLLIENTTTALETLSSTKIIGSLKRDVWNKLVWTLSLSGNILFSDKVKTVRLEPDNIIRVTTNNTRFAKIKYERLIVFDPDIIQNIPNEVLKPAENLYKVYDWMAITNGMSQKIDYLSTGDHFVDEVYLYPTDRVDGVQLSLKDILTISYLTKEQLQNFEYSDTYARFKVLKLMKQNGIRGNMNGWRTKNKVKRCYYAFKVEPTIREVIPVNKNLYQNSDSIRFLNLEFEDILEKYTKKINNSNYIYNLFSGLFSGKEN